MASISDFREWTEKVRSFTERLKKLPGIDRLDFKIKPPASARKLAALAEKWPRGLPAVLRDFWSSSSAELCCQYIWEPEDQEKEWGRFAIKSFYGGIHFGTQNVYPGNSGADPRDENMRHVLGKEGQELLCRSALFHMFGDGDCLGLDPTVNYDDPAVVYLVHDDKTSTQVASTFTPNSFPNGQGGISLARKLGLRAMAISIDESSRGRSGSNLGAGVNFRDVMQTEKALGLYRGLCVF